MTDRSWRVVASVVATVLALVAGATIAFVVVPRSLLAVPGRAATAPVA